jgi:hypothetical protein
MFAVRPTLRKLRALTRRERALLLEAALLLPAVHGLQQLLPFRRWRTVLARLSRCSERVSAATPDEIARAVERARRGLPGEYKCLPAAYTAQLLLRLRGYPSTVQVGVARDAAGKVEAHAWVVWEGQILIGALPDLARFVPLPPLPV